ncbi:MAG TPA: dihydroorotate dehydrogenase electron transfer subunit [Bacteroidota bacterium]|nr:dihydroorotate dehydrogenase electron transfer subunit [Bacteroidota bacterium]
MSNETKPQQQWCVVENCTEIAEKIFRLSFKFPQLAAAVQPGQFVNIRVSETEEPLLRRPFSVSRVEGDLIEIMLQIVGSGTRILSEKKSGELLDVLGPLGQPFHLQAEFDTALIVAGGLGVAPFPLLTAALMKIGKHVETFAGFRSAQQECTEHLENIHLATDDGSRGFHGTVVKLIEDYLEKKSTAKYKVFACGPTKMLMALTELGKRKSICCELSLEGQMACGVGICQGCPVELIDEEKKYALVCKDGPTFLSTEINLREAN